MSINGRIATHPMILISLHEKALPIANVAVIKAVFGNTNENQVIEKTIRPGPIADQCAALAMMKKKIANLING
jgi:hypothetical protein